MKGDIPLSQLQSDIHTALKSWHETKIETSPLNYLHLFHQVRAQGKQNARQITNEILLKALDELSLEYEVEASLLRKRFLDGLVMHSVANQLNVGESTAYRKQQEAIKQLAVIVQQRERQARRQFQTSLEKRLNLPRDVKLFGVEQRLKTLQEVLTTSDQSLIVSIEGMGGIGKTALANALIRQPTLTSQFCDIAWVSAKQQEFLPGIGLAHDLSPALTRESLTDMLLRQLDNATFLTKSPQEKRLHLAELLKQDSYLIVVDNLETVVDYQTLLPVLRELANPSKFLLTSRHSLRANADVYCHSVDELNHTEAFRFVRYEAEIRGLSELASASEDQLKGIYEVVGGNPLALKLVIGQLTLLPLTQILDNLKQARGQKIDTLYTFIYWQAWHMLDATSQQTLLVMPLAQDSTLDQLRVLSNLDLEQLIQALEQLTMLSLVQVGGELDERRYSIHRLTETFLLTEAINWMS